MTPFRFSVVVGVVAVVLSMAPFAMTSAQSQEVKVDVGAILDSAFREWTGASGENSQRQVEALCDKAILSLTGMTLPDAQLRQLLTAYELRARTRFALGNVPGASDDFRAILMQVPAYAYGSSTRERGGDLNPRSVVLFDKVKGETVGSVLFKVTPKDAEVTFRGAILTPEERTGERPILSPVGTYPVSGKLAMYGPVQKEVTVQPGSTVTVELPLERQRSQIDFITSVPNVEVYVEGTFKGRTAGVVPARYSGSRDVAELGAQAAYLPVTEVSNGEAQVEMKLDCYTTVQQKVKIEKPDHVFLPVKLTKASKVLKITGGDGTVWIDGQDTKARLPYQEEICPKAEPRLVEVRNSRGRDVFRVDPLADKTFEYAADPKPAIAILSQAGLPDGFTEDYRQTLEDLLIREKAEGVRFFSLSNSLVDRELKTENVNRGWLSHDVEGNAITKASLVTTDNTRQTAGRNIMDRLGVQGLAEITVPDYNQDSKRLYLSYIARGSGVPETIEIKLNDQKSVRSAVSKINEPAPPSRVWSGVYVADITGVPGALVLRQTRVLTHIELKPGDVIQSLEGRKIPDGSSFDAEVSSAKPGQPLTLQVQRAVGGPPVPVQLIPQVFPRVVSIEDATLLVNKRLLEFRLAVLDASPQDQPIAHLNLAVVLMKVEEWQEALRELEKAELAPLPAGGEGISPGTVHYYRGLCLDQQGNTADANRAYTAALNSAGALLTADGPPVRQLAQQKLNDKTRR